MHTHMHTHLPQHTDTHISFFPRLWNPVQSPTPVPSLISLTQVLHMLRLYVICVWFYVIWCCSLVASDFSSKILSPWVLSFAYLPTPTKFPSRPLCVWDSPGKNTGVGCYSFSRGFSQPRTQTRVSYIAGRFFTD